MESCWNTMSLSRAEQRNADGHLVRWIPLRAVATLDRACALAPSVKESGKLIALPLGRGTVLCFDSLKMRVWYLSEREVCLDQSRFTLLPIDPEVQNEWTNFYDAQWTEEVVVFWLPLTLHPYLDALVFGYRFHVGAMRNGDETVEISLSCSSPT